MPFVTVTIPETVESISRPITYDIIREVQEITKIDKSAKIVFAGDTGKMQQAGSAIDEESKQALLAAGKYIYIEVEEDYDPQYLASTAIALPEQIPIFNDPEISVLLKPLYATTMVTIKFKFQAPSRTEVLRWRDDIRMRLSRNRDINLHDITYHYMVPPPYMLLLRDIYNNRERLLQDNQTFEQYVSSNITTRAKIISDMSGKDIRLAVSEKQCRIVGMYTFDSVPEKPQRENDLSVWSIEFGYKFTYEKPNMMSARYPIMVYNELLPKEYIAFGNTQYDIDNVEKSASVSVKALHYFEASSQAQKSVNFKAEFNIPSYDDFVPDNKPTSTVGVFNALCQVDETDKVTLMNLNDLGGIIIDPDIMYFIQHSEAPFLGELYLSIFTISLYSNYVLNETGTIMCLPDLTIQATRPLNLHNIHHMRFSIITDLSLIDQAFFVRLMKYPKALYKLVISLNEALRNNPQLQSIRELPYVTPADFSLLYSIMTGFRYVPKSCVGAAPISNTSMVATPMSNIYSSNPLAVNSVNDPFACLRGLGLELLRSNTRSMKTVETGMLLSYKKQIQ